MCSQDHKNCSRPSQRRDKNSTCILYLILVKLPRRTKDNTHFSPEGADKVARIIVELIKESRLPLANYLQKEFEMFPLNLGIRAHDLDVRNREEIVQKYHSFTCPISNLHHKSIS